jgi:hypothetical protein
VKWGIPGKHKNKIQDHIATILILRERGLQGSGIIRAYHQRRVVPLMARVLPLHQMAPDALLEGTMFVMGLPNNGEIVR